VTRKVLGVTAAVLLAIFGTFVLASYVQGAEDRAQSDEELVDVLVVSSGVDAGTSSEDLATSVLTQEVPRKVLAQDAVSDLSSLKGKVANVDLVAGEQLVSTRFVKPANFDDRRTTVAQVPEGLHEVTVALDPQRALAGKLQAGDTVGFTASFDPFSIVGEKAFEVLTEGMSPEEKAQFVEALAQEDPDGEFTLPGDDTASTTHMTLHKLIVTDVSLEPSTRDSYEEVNVSEDDTTGATPDGLVYVTFATDAPSVERIVFAAEFGRIWLSYEPKDADESGTQIMTRSGIYEETIEIETVAAVKEGGQ
jgi:pilus assembly protein CpaB